MFQDAEFYLFFPCRVSLDCKGRVIFAINLTVIMITYNHSVLVSSLLRDYIDPSSSEGLYKLQSISMSLRVPWPFPFAVYCETLVDFSAIR